MRHTCEGVLVHTHPLYRDNAVYVNRQGRNSLAYSGLLMREPLHKRLKHLIASSCPKCLCHSLACSGHELLICCPHHFHWLRHVDYSTLNAALFPLVHIQLAYE